MSVRYSARSLAKLDAIYDYLQSRNASAARDVMRSIGESVQHLEELRKSTACQIFTSIDAQEAVIEKRLNELTSDRHAMKQLIGYEWITRQWEEVV